MLKTRGAACHGSALGRDASVSLVRERSICSVAKEFDTLVISRFKRVEQ